MNVKTKRNYFADADITLSIMSSGRRRRQTRQLVSRARGSVDSCSSQSQRFASRGSRSEIADLDESAISAEGHFGWLLKI